MSREGLVLVNGNLEIVEVSTMRIGRICGGDRCFSCEEGVARKADTEGFHCRDEERSRRGTSNSRGACNPDAPGLDRLSQLVERARVLEASSRKARWGSPDLAGSRRCAPGAR